MAPPTPFRQRVYWIVASILTAWLVSKSVVTADEFPAARPLRPVGAAESALPSGAIARIGDPHFGHNRLTQRVAWRPGTRQFATAGRDGFVRIWDSVTRREVIRGPNGRSPRVLKYTDDGEQLLAVVSQLRAKHSVTSVTRWDADTGDVIADKLLPDLQPWAWSHFAVGSPRLDRMAYAKGSVLQVHDLAADRLLYEVDMTKIPSARRSAGGDILPAAMDFSPDGRILYVAVDDGVLRLLPDEQRQLPRLELGHLPPKPRIFFSPSDLVVSSDGRWLATCRDRWTMVFDLTTGNRRHILTSGSGGHSLVRFSPNSQILAGGGHYGHVKLWNVASGEMLEGFPVSHDRLSDVAFSDDGALLVMARGHEATRILEVATGNERTADLTPIFRDGLGFSSDGATLATLGERRRLFLWNATTFEPTGQIELPLPPAYYSSLLSPDLKRLVVANREAGSKGGSWNIYDLSSGREARLSAVIAAAELPEGKPSDGDSIKILEVLPARSFAFDSASQVLIGCAIDRYGHVITKRRWDARTGKLLEASAAAVGRESLNEALSAMKDQFLLTSAMHFPARLTPLAGGRIAWLRSAWSLLGRDPPFTQTILFNLERMAVVDTVPRKVFSDLLTRSDRLQIGGSRLGLDEREIELTSDYRGRISDFVRDEEEHRLIIANQKGERRPTAQWQITVFDSDAQEPVATFDAGAAAITKLALSSDATRLASGHADGTVILWRMIAPK